TLPLIYALESAGADGRKLVHAVLEEKGFESVRPEQITALVHNSGALDRTRALALDFANRAKACLDGNSHSDFGRALRAVPDFIVGRDN
ncbi:MAG: polyprenyl synthetase family protein, partial [Candidatus Acidiferrales bacterium]